ncbi:MAG: hypothetical protein HZT40_19585 [Candidatus Thiothrix singaporensis]|uniref:Uncharacterized protein n=1 Tax=Candidatus Thiothrix singaporensis TaxID=2799669 RepID=A0A7L6AWV3_9GAMM|nr:MAG: hypothetical protein HZT40_19585 [Candidatus Thiothrix singaporensis]
MLKLASKLADVPGKDTEVMQLYQQAADKGMLLPSFCWGSAMSRVLALKGYGCCRQVVPKSGGTRGCERPVFLGGLYLNGDGVEKMSKKPWTCT